MKFTSVRQPRKAQAGQIIETKTAWHLRYYITDSDTGQRRKTCIKLANKSDQYPTRESVEPLRASVMNSVGAPEANLPTALTTITDYTEKTYLPWVELNQSAATYDGYKQIWKAIWKPRVGNVALSALTTKQVSDILTDLAENGNPVKGTVLPKPRLASTPKPFRSSTLGHIKWFLSGVYGYAITQGAASRNPVAEARWNVGRKIMRQRSAPQRVYSLPEVLSMLDVLAPIDLRAACAVALTYFAGLRPSEVRGLRWEDVTEQVINVRRSVWRGFSGDTKTDDSTNSVPLIEPLRGLLEKLRASEWGPQAPTDPILQNEVRKPLSLDSLSGRVIRPALTAAGIVWKGYYPCRRGVSSLVTAISKDGLNSTRLLRHSTPITALKSYTRADDDDVAEAMKAVEQKVSKLTAKGQVQ